MQNEAEQRSARLAARWPERIIELARQWGRRDDDQDREQVLGELWTLLHVGLDLYARDFARRFGGLPLEDLRDAAADKALDLIVRLDSHAWDPAASTPAQLAAFLSKVARNGVIDLIRRKGREISMEEDSDGHPRAIADVRTDPRLAPVPAEPAEHARAIVECARALSPKARLAWLLRVFHEMTSIEIARHPDMATTPAAVDTMLMRCRSLMRKCIASKGFEPDRLPAGTFTLLWQMIVEDVGPGATDEGIVAPRARREPPA